MANQAHLGLKVDYADICSVAKDTELVNLVYFIFYDLTHSYSSRSAGDRGLAGFQGLKGLFVTESGFF